MRNFDTSLDQERLSAVSTSPTVTETVRVVPKVTPYAITKDADQWDWRDLRDYVVANMERFHGITSTDPLKESGIFKSFLKRWGSTAPDIARYAFERAGGWWLDEPVTIHRFCKNADPFFAAPIADRLTEVAVPEGW